MEDQTAKRKKETVVSDVKVNPLRNERIYVRFVPHNNAVSSSDKHHIMYGARADGAYDDIVVPMLRNGKYKNVLTNEEKDFLEEALGLDSNALSVYNTTNNYWDDYKIRIVAKEGLRLDLSDPLDYIKYKVLLANTDLVAPSFQERLDRPKATYLYELVHEEEETALENAKMDATMSSYKEFGKIDNDFNTMRVLTELLDARPYAANNKIEFFRSRINQLIQLDPKKFYSAITDPLLHAKVLLRVGTENGVVAKRGDFYYLKSDNSPLCASGEEPTLSVAARYINLPAHQDIKFLLENEISGTKKK